MAEKLKIIPLGGLNEIGKNMTAYEYGGEIVIVDCGMAFPGDDMYGIDCVIPDVSYLVKNHSRLRGMFITHGHEDHIGAIPYVLKQISTPIYCTRFTAGLIKLKLQEHGLLNSTKLITVEAGQTVKAGKFQVEFIHVNHSIADSVAFAIHTRMGTVVHTGDFKIDSTPIDGEVIDLARFGELGKQGVTAIAVDCRSGKVLNAFAPTVRRVLSDKIEANAQKGMAGKPLRLMVVGIPNTGKSSFINRMAGKNKAKVADKPGVTRQNQWFSIGSGIELLDTPGVLWPKFDDPDVGLRLAFIGSVKDTILDIERIAARCLTIMNENYPERIKERYKLEFPPESEEFERLEMLARKRGMLISGGEPDTERAAVMLLDEYRAGKLG